MVIFSTFYVYILMYERNLLDRYRPGNKSLDRKHEGKQLSRYSYALIDRYCDKEKKRLQINPYQYSST